MERELQIYSGYIVQTKHSLRVFHTLRELTREIGMARKTIYNGFKSGRLNMDSYFEGIFKIEKGEIVKQILNKDTHGNKKKYFEVVEYVC